RVHPPLRHDTCADLAVLSAIERQDREVAPVAERGVYPARSAVVDRRRAPLGGPVRGPLQSGSSAQRDRLRHAPGQAGRTRAANLCRARSQTGRSAAAATTPPSTRPFFGAGRAGRAPRAPYHDWRSTQRRAKLIRPGETEAGSAGTQPCRGITRWKLIEDDERGTASTAVLPFFIDFDRFPHALKIPAPKGRNTIAIVKR